MNEKVETEEKNVLEFKNEEGIKKEREEHLEFTKKLHGTKTVDELIELLTDVEIEFLHYIKAKEAETFSINGLTFTRSKDKTFKKNRDFIVLKERLFRIQDVSVKKIILKLFNSVSPTMPSGIFHEVGKE